MTDNQKEQIVKLRAAGNSYGKIAQTLGLSLNTIKSFCHRNDICMNAPVESPVAPSGETAV